MGGSVTRAAPRKWGEMIDAILKGKMPLTEDVVTSCVVGMLDSMPREHGLLAWLERAQPCGAMHEALHFGPAAHAKVIYWPRTTKHFEPDVFVMVEDGAVAHAIVLEANTALRSRTGTTDPQDLCCDQLVRYWEALRRLDMPGASRPCWSGPRRPWFTLPTTARPRRSVAGEHRQKQRRDPTRMVVLARRVGSRGAV